MEAGYQAIQQRERTFGQEPVIMLRNHLGTMLELPKEQDQGSYSVQNGRHDQGLVQSIQDYYNHMQQSIDD